MIASSRRKLGLRKGNLKYRRGMVFPKMIIVISLKYVRECYEVSESRPHSALVDLIYTSLFK